MHDLETQRSVRAHWRDMTNGGIGSILIPLIAGGGCGQPKPPPPIPGICGVGKARGSNWAYIFRNNQKMISQLSIN